MAVASASSRDPFSSSSPVSTAYRCLTVSVVPVRVILLLAILHGLIHGQANPEILIVDPVNGPYYTIQSAIDYAATNDTVEVLAGIYPEELRPERSMTLRSRDGPDVTVIDGGDSLAILVFLGIDLIVEGLSFENGYSGNGGGAIRYADGYLDAINCTFRKNRGQGSIWRMANGGAVLAKGGSRGIFANCLFVDNKVSGWRSGRGGAVYITGSWDKSESDVASLAGPSTLPTFEFLDCTFIRNCADYVPGIVSTEVIDIRRCLFVDKRGCIGSFVSAKDGSTISCTLHFDAPSPQVEGSWAKSSNTGMIDPRLCPGDPETVHESSVTVADWEGCGHIGGLPIGCTGPTIVAIKHFDLEPAPDQVIRIYGYGLEEVLDVTLEGPSGELVSTREHTLEGPWQTTVFDLSGQRPGEWSLVMRTATSGEVRVDGLMVSAVRVYGFFNGWVPEPAIFEGRIGGRNFANGMALSLECAAGGGPVVPVEIVERIGDDTLLVQADLTQSDEGAYDLSVHVATGEIITVQPALYLGTPTVIRVPEDVPTIREALATALPCEEILVDPGRYEESLVIDKPVRLRAAEPEEWTSILPDSTGGRIIHILPDAGPLTEIEGFSVRNGEVVGPGAGIYCESPALLRDNRIGNNRSSGPGARGAGIFAVPGARIIDNEFYENRIGSSDSPDHMWSTDPETGGVAGGLFCLDCWVEGNDIENNSAPSAGGIVADGVVRGNNFLENRAAWDGQGPGHGALRGEVFNNRFDYCCGSETPYLLVEGPSRLIGNTFTDIMWAMCMAPNSIHLKGSIDLIGNTFGAVGVQACLCTDDVREPRSGHFRMEGNYFLDGWWESWVHLYLDPSLGLCREDPAEPQTRIPSGSISFSCNITNSIEVWYHDTSGEYECDNCAHDVDNIPPGCPSTIPQIEYACDPVPVLLQSQGLEPTEEGIRLFWSVPLDVRVDGFDVEREYSGTSERLTLERLPFCQSCEYLDRKPPDTPPVLYKLLIYSGSDEPASVQLGVWDGSGPIRHRPGLSLPNPHPIRGTATLRFTLPAGGGFARLELFDLQGRRITVIEEGNYTSGTRSFVWDGGHANGWQIASGVYLLRLSTDTKTWIRKVLLLH